MRHSARTYDIQDMIDDVTTNMLWQKAEGKGRVYE